MLTKTRLAPIIRGGHIIGHGTQLAMERARVKAVSDIERLGGYRTAETPSRQVKRRIALKAAKAERTRASREADRY